MENENIKKEIGLSLLKAETEAEANINAERNELLKQIRLSMLPGLLKRKLRDESDNLRLN